MRTARWVPGHPWCSLAAGLPEEGQWCVVEARELVEAAAEVAEEAAFALGVTEASDCAVHLGDGVAAGAGFGRCASDDEDDRLVADGAEDEPAGVGVWAFGVYECEFGAFRGDVDCCLEVVPVAGGGEGSGVGAETDGGLAGHRAGGQGEDGGEEGRGDEDRGVASARARPEHLWLKRVFMEEKEGFADSGGCSGVRRGGQGVVRWLEGVACVGL